MGMDGDTIIGQWQLEKGIPGSGLTYNYITPTIDKNKYTSVYGLVRTRTQATMRGNFGCCNIHSIMCAHVHACLYIIYICIVLVSVYMLSVVSMVSVALSAEGPSFYT